LLSDVSGSTKDWHEFGMEWKEHVAWISPHPRDRRGLHRPVLRHQPDPPRASPPHGHHPVHRRVGYAAIAGAFGAFITKVAPVK